MSSQSNRRTDEQLEAILFEAGRWVVNGRRGEVLCHAPSLKRAIERADDYAERGAPIIALCRLPADNIVVFAAQRERLCQRLRYPAAH